MNTLTGASPAKINLTLRVVRRRDDGYHEIESLAAKVGLTDDVNVTPRDDGHIALTCDAEGLPTDDRNLAVRAARLLRERADASCGVDIRLAKRIPAGAGLGGGSSNAATALLLLNDLWRTGLRMSELAQIAATIGADVPLFLRGPLCVMRGRGEMLTEVAAELRGCAALVLPEIACATADVYAAWDQMRGKSRPAPRIAPADLLADRPTMRTLMSRLFNDLQSAAFEVNPTLRVLYARILQAGDGPVCLTGSGSAMFRLFDDRTDAEAFARRVRAVGDLRVEVVDVGRW